MVSRAGGRRHIIIIIGLCTVLVCGVPVPVLVRIRVNDSTVQYGVWIPYGICTGTVIILCDAEMKVMDHLLVMLSPHSLEHIL